MWFSANGAKGDTQGNALGGINKNHNSAEGARVSLNPIASEILSHFQRSPALRD